MGSFFPDGLCRLCGAVEEETVGIFDKDQGAKRTSPFFLIKKCLPILVREDDVLPKRMCCPCLKRLEDLWDFVYLVLSTQAKLTNSVKQRPTSSALSHATEEGKDKVEDKESEEAEKDTDGDMDAMHCPPLVMVEVTEGDPLDDGSEDSKLDSSPKSEAEEEGESDTKGPLPAAGTKSAHVRKSRAPKKSLNYVNTLESQSDADHAEEKEHLVPEKKKRGPGRPLICHQCGSSFPKFAVLVQHCDEQHESVMQLSCEACPQVFNSLRDLQTHRRVHQTSRLEVCLVCGKMVNSRYMKRHMLVHTEERPFACDQCSNAFRSSSELQIHRRTHLPGQLRYTYMCEVCGRQFTQKGNLDSHRRIHTGERPFKCDFCPKAFSQKGNLDEHRRIHTNEKPYCCEVCGARFLRQGQIRIHLRSHTGQRPYPCTICPKRFKRLQTLRKHQRMHLDLRPYPCDICEKRFRDRDKLVVHRRIHTGERPYSCGVCGRGFYESGNLIKHKRVHEKDNTINSSLIQQQHLFGPQQEQGCGSVEKSGRNVVLPLLPIPASVTNQSHVSMTSLLPKQEHSLGSLEGSSGRAALLAQSTMSGQSHAIASGRHHTSSLRMQQEHDLVSSEKSGAALPLLPIPPHASDHSHAAVASARIHASSTTTPSTSQHSHSHSMIPMALSMGLWPPLSMHQVPP
ncbi:unnamed protein product [Darwinula stevensoni]|uniref:Uncharacterized protein n=1 Tax=Darwinula stevensoni TaxID=69355 RepID=A0A7R8XGE4_9CRUS|nr:unnamed protein product [Darwinula stevensoni]CAG0895915.1 unnamed protein product [Darwinula stevensoni]